MVGTASETFLNSTDHAEPVALRWHSNDHVWMLSLFGTAIGAGTLFLPIAAGIGGIWPLILVSFIIFPMIFYSHRALCRFVLASSSKGGGLKEAAAEHLGTKGAHIVSILYFLAVFPILLMYSIAMTNTSQSFMVNQCGLHAPHRSVTALALLLIMMSVIRFDHKKVLRLMSTLVYPFIASLLFFSIYLIPHWHGAVFHQQAMSVDSAHATYTSVYLLIPTIIFAFNHTAIISSFAISQKKQYGLLADKKSTQILRNSHILMIVTVMFFVFSCVLSLSPEDLAKAKAENLSILSYFANTYHLSFIKWLAPVVALVAVSNSFLGHYMGASESIFGLFTLSARRQEKCERSTRMGLLIDALILFSCWLIATLNPDILSMIQSVNGPVVAMILFILPMYAIQKVPALKKFKSAFSDLFMWAIGLIAISGIIYGLF